MNSYHCRIPILIYVTNDILEIASSSRVSSSFEHEWELLDVRFLLNYLSPVLLLYGHNLIQKEI